MSVRSSVGATPRQRKSGSQAAGSVAMKANYMMALPEASFRLAFQASCTCLTTLAGIGT